VLGDDGGAAVRVLIVEDDQRVRTALRHFLSASAGFEVVGDAAGPAEALQIARDIARDAARDIARDAAPAVALVDVLLPDAHHGLDLLRVLTGELRIPAVAMSIHSGLRLSVLAAGACRFLPKDGVPDLLLAALRAAVRDGGSGPA